MLDLSIVIPTCNRPALLEKAISSIAVNTQCNYELIVVDGSSCHATHDVLLEAKESLGDRLRVIREEKREGFVRAANKGFRIATGRNLTWLNDDARALPGALDRAVQQMDAEEDDVAFVAMFHRWHSLWNVAYETQIDGRLFRLCHVRGTLYANFALGRRTTFEKLEYLDERYYFYAADPDLSLKAWHAGMRVVPAFGAALDHDEVEDDRRAADADRGREDNQKLFAKWDLPARNPHHNTFDPARPCTLNGLRSPSAAAA